MRTPRQRQQGMSHSISCTDEEWEMICEGAARAGIGASAWFTRCALDVNPLSGKARPLVLDERQQENLVKAITRLAEPFSGHPERLSRIWEDVRYLLRKRVRALMRQGRSDEARARLREAFGDKRAAWIESWARQRRHGDD